MGALPILWRKRHRGRVMSRGGFPYRHIPRLPLLGYGILGSRGGIVEHGFYLALGITIFLPFLQYAVPTLPRAVAWAGAAGGVIVMLVDLLGADMKPSLNAVILFLIGCLFFGGAAQQLMKSQHKAPYIVSPQPDFVILPPDGGSRVLLWGPPQEMYMQTVNWKGKLPKSFVGGPYPLFRIKNLGATTAFSVRAKWEQGIEETSFISMISRSSAFQKYNAKYNDKEGRFSIGGEETKTNQWNTLIYGDFTQTFPFIAPQIDNTTYVEFAIPIYTLAEIYFCAAISGQSDPTSSEPISIPFKLTISWDRPEGGAAAIFNVIATARNMNKNPPGRSQLMTEDGAWRNPPLVMAEITFEIEKKGGP